MSTDIRAVAAFGKRSSDEVWARAQHDKRELAICPWRFSGWLTVLVAAAFLLLLDSVRLLAGGGEGVGPIGEGLVWLSGAPGVLAGLILLLPAALLAQTACALLSIGMTGQPLILVDTVGLAVPSRGAGVIMTWEEVAAIVFTPGAVRFDRKPRAVRRLCTGPAYEKQRARAPLLLVSGGAEALRQAIAEIRPDMARRLFS
ncbi:MAG TPA: hypothetical protein VHG92_03270 [Afifellaceae bacterium]|nr:hypothetical protein [Afifellaceae bacterium]